MPEQAARNARRDRDPRAGDADPPPAERRTIVIRGQVGDRYAAPRRRAGTSGAYGRIRPERAALWAVLLGVALVVAALASAHI